MSKPLRDIWGAFRVACLPVLLLAGIFALLVIIASPGTWKITLLSVLLFFVGPIPALLAEPSVPLLGFTLLNLLMILSILLTRVDLSTMICALGLLLWCLSGMVLSFAKM
jgi:hypothetical protein